MKRRMWAVAGMAVLGLAFSVQARQVFPGVAGEWVLMGSVEYRLRVPGSRRERFDAPLPDVAASFEPTGDFAMEWVDEAGMTDVRATGWYEQKRGRVSSDDALVAPFFAQVLLWQLARAGVHVASFTQDGAEMDVVLFHERHLGGTLTVWFRVVTASGRKGWASASMEFVGVR